MEKRKQTIEELRAIVEKKVALSSKLAEIFASTGDYSLANEMQVEKRSYETILMLIDNYEFMDSIRESLKDVE